MRRVILVLADGLRPDAITPSVMPSLDALSRAYSMALRARTVRPSTTVAALASLATGVGPDSHRLVEPGLGFLPRLGSLRPVARELARGGIPTDVVMGELGRGAWPVARALAAAAGVRQVTTAGSQAPDTAAAVGRQFATTGDQVLFVYLPDCDRAGHAHGWMSAPYLRAAAGVDAAVATLTQWLDDALIVILADHGGGGVTPNDHDEPHPVNDHIPFVVAGRGATRRHQLTRPISILDLPPTLLWWFGRPVPTEYEGRPLVEAFVPTPRAVEVFA